MKLYSTNHQSPEVDLREAVMAGLAPDGGLYMPTEIPQMPPEFFASLKGKSFQQIALEVAHTLFCDDLPEDVISRIVTESYDFPLPLVELETRVHVLELFHGPTLAFKDFAARFMARLMSYYQKQIGKEITVLVATSGDTGSAVASGFLGVPGIRVVILYPSKKVSPLQEAQLTTMGQNITALEVEGTFDDCQALVKKAFVDPELSKKFSLASANSINIARLLPQSFYYFYAASLCDAPPVFSVPSGNFGNLTAGLIAKKMGLPVERFVASTNANDVFTQYLATGTYTPRPSKQTLSNAMDVGSPSNFARILALYDNDISKIRADIASYSFTDDETRAAIRSVYQKHGYILDPHGAVGYLGLKKIHENQPGSTSPGIFMETAHPAKFLETVEETLHIKVPVPERLQSCLGRSKQAIKIPALFDALKNTLQ